MMLFATLIVVSVLRTEAAPIPCTVQEHVRMSGTPDPGALLKASVDSTVGVVLTDIPENMRSRVVNLIKSQPQSFWRWRAEKQIALTNYDLVFPLDRGALPLTFSNTEKWSFTFTQPVRQTLRRNQNEIDAVVVNYHMETIILTDYDSPEKSQHKLRSVGGIYSVPFEFPVDPTLLHQRTGNACYAEYDFPTSSIDPEDPEVMYGYWCTEHNAAPADDTNPTCKYCHCSYPRPEFDCVEALERFTGRVKSAVVFQRIAWNAAKANQYRFEPDGQPVTTGADMIGWTPDLKHQEEIYRYFTPNDCALREGCIGAAGWRKVLLFHTTDYNNGIYPIHIGDIPDYDGTNPIIDNGLFVYSPCHNHYHFNFYANFSWTGPGGMTAGDKEKRGFCLLSYYRIVNSEWSPLPNDYGFCTHQGIASGWADIYSIGIPCQWKDVTTITTPTLGTLSSHANFKNLLCEGLEMCEEDGVTQRFVPTGLSTCSETSSSSNCANVSTFECQQSAGTSSNNAHSVPAFIGGCGASYVTRGVPAQALYTIGPLRDTEFSMVGTRQLRQCQPGQQKVLRCSIRSSQSNSQEPQVIRVCESSIALGCGLACRYNDSLANQVLKAVEPNFETITFSCPGFRDTVEVGGRYSLYQAMVIVTDGNPNIRCVEVDDDDSLMDLWDNAEQYRTMKLAASATSLQSASFLALLALLLL